MDNVLIEYIAGQFKKETGIDLRNDKMAMMRLKEGAEKAKSIIFQFDYGY